MKRLIPHLSALTLLTGLGVFATGCTTETTTPTSTTTATSLRANSMSSTSMGVFWARGSGDVSTDTLVAKPSDGGAPVMTTTSGSGAVLTGLRDGGSGGGLSYEITVHSSNATSAALTWATAPRSGVITLYETADNTPGHFSGLDLDDPNNVKAVTVVNSNLADVVLASDASVVPSGAFLGSAGVTGTGILPGVAKVTLMNSNTALVNGGLDSDYYASDLRSLIPGTNLNDGVTAVDFSGNLGTTDTHDAIIRVKTSTGHFARIDVIRQPSGLLWKMVNNRTAIDVKVSEQASTLPYAGRGTQVTYPAVVAKRSAGVGFFAN